MCNHMSNWIGVMAFTSTTKRLISLCELGAEVTKYVHVYVYLFVGEQFSSTTDIH